MNPIMRALSKWFVGATAPDVNPRMEQLMYCYYHPSRFFNAESEAAQGSIAVDLGGAVRTVGLLGESSMDQSELDRYGQLFAAAPTMMEAIRSTFPLLNMLLSRSRKKEPLTETELHDLQLMTTAALVELNKVMESVVVR